jgi:ParB/RepB/Spo0J family partition protein
MNKTESEKIHILILADIAASATQPRKDFKQAALEEMAASIQQRGVVQPIIVRPVACIENEEHRKAAGKALYELVAGERRCRGSKLAGKKDVPAVIRELSDMAALEVQVIENAQRQDLDHLEEGDSYDRLLKSGQANVDELSAKIGKSRATIYGRIKLLDAPDNRPVRRRTRRSYSVLYSSEPRAIVVSLEPGDVITFREAGRRQTWSVAIDRIFHQAVREAAFAQRRERTRAAKQRNPNS